MKDSILKGTGNSRFLKSAVPAGTSWADSLAMLQAGTFPIDFNGINTEGFQQVGTPLNKANLLKDVTALTLGLTGDVVPNDMFNALAHAGDLHVWRKTVVVKDPVPEVPGSYTLGTAQRLYVATRTFTNSNYESYVKGVLASNAITIDLDGKVTLTDPAKVNLYIYNHQDGVTSQTGREAISGYSYFLIPSTSASSIGCGISMPQDTIYYIPSTSSYYRTSSSFGDQSSFDAAQLVTGVPGTPAIPAGTTTTYPVSTNPNAYQEGDDAKEAWYTLGEVVTGSFRMSSTAPRNAYLYEYANSVGVNENGAVFLQNPEAVNFNSDSHAGYESTFLSLVAGKFLRYVRRDSMADDSSAPDTQPPFNATPSEIIYVPSDATITSTSTYPAGFFLDKYQPVTGYAAIPAGTTIEYLGKLGDKARVQVVSYVGTGTYGKDNKNQLTFSRKPRFIMVPGDAFGYAYIPKGRFYYVVTGNYATLEDLYCVWDDDTNTMTWYHPSYPYRQYNESGKKYAFVAIY